MSDRVARPQTSTETRIADGVLSVIAENGFDVVSVRTVAQACDVSAGTVQYHFSTRQALLTAGLLRSFERQQNEVLGRDRRISTFDELLSTLKRLLPLEESLREDAVAWVSFVAAAGSRPWLAEIVNKAILTLQGFLASQMVDPHSRLRPVANLSAEQAARLIVSLLNGITLDLLAAPGNAPYASGDLECGLALILERG